MTTEEKTPRDFSTVTCGPCPMCSKSTQFILASEDVERWQNGEKIQFAMPYLLAMQRETLISGVCSQECWDTLWSEEEA